jgi:Domain of unknown function (DUF222)
MSTTAGPDARPHVVAAFSARLHEVLDGLLEAPVWSMSAAEQRTVLVELSRAESRICELRLRVVAAADRADAVADTGATSTAAWWAHRTRQLRSSAHADVRLARLLDDTYAATRDAWARGLVDAGQARVIVAALGRPWSLREVDDAFRHGTRTTRSPGRTVESPASGTGGCCARSTIDGLTTRTTTRPTSLTARSRSTGAPSHRNSDVASRGPSAPTRGSVRRRRTSRGAGPSGWSGRRRGPPGCLRTRPARRHGPRRGRDR